MKPGEGRGHLDDRAGRWGALAGPAARRPTPTSTRSAPSNEQAPATGPAPSSARDPRRAQPRPRVGRRPESGRLHAFMRAAYKGIKAGDSNALVIGGGPAPGTGNHPGATIEDVDFINGCTTPAPRTPWTPWRSITTAQHRPRDRPVRLLDLLPGAELYRDVHGQARRRRQADLADRVGYLLDAGQDMGQYDWMKVSSNHRPTTCAGLPLRAGELAVARRQPPLQHRRRGLALTRTTVASTPRRGSASSTRTTRPARPTARSKDMLGQVARSTAPSRNGGGSGSSATVGAATVGSSRRRNPNSRPPRTKSPSRLPSPRPRRIRPRAPSRCASPTQMGPASTCATRRVRRRKC